MRVWKLIPLDTASLHWLASDYLGNVIVRADDEDAAHALATQQFGKAVERIPLALTIINPWESDLVACEPYDGTEYAQDGPPEVLWPQE